MPIVSDVFDERARSNTGTVKAAVDDFEAKLNGFPANPRYPPQIPTVELSRVEECNKEVNKLVIQIDLPLSFRDAVNSSQFHAVETILNHKISVTWGPPRNSKSHVLSEAML